jgi:nitrite reductase/ring-hydroxylating ferredoxin subunit
MSSDEAWSVIEGVDPQTTTFPVSVRVGDTPIWVYRADIGMFGVQNECPHTNRTLGNAKVIGERNMIRCFYHNYTFRLSDGGGVNCPGYSIAVYDAKEDGGKLYVRPRTAAA